MIAVSDSSPLILLSKIGELNLLRDLFESLLIPKQVYDEVVGPGLAGSAEVANAPWILVREVEILKPRDPRLGLGELACIALAIQVKPDLVLMDDLNARRAARAVGLKVAGTVGLLEHAFRVGSIRDLRSCYGKLIFAGAYVDTRIFNVSLAALGLDPI